MNTCSLLIPCYNAANYLPRLWQTVQAQTVPFDEIICYDDGSTDQTAEVASSLGAKVIRGEVCRGAAFARNQLAQAATCSWIHFHDADDTLHPEYLAQTKAKIAQDVDVIVCNADWIDEVTHDLIIPRRYTQQEFRENALKATLRNPIGVISGLYRREVFLTVQGFDESYQCWEDADLHVRLAAKGARFRVVDIVLSFSLRHDRGLSRDQFACSECRFQLLQSYAKQFDDSVKPVIAQEAEKVVVQFLQHKNWNAAAEAATFCRSLGIRPPTTRNWLLNAMKPIVPALWLLEFQQLIRTSRILH